jgi:hypothetical protein
MGNVITSERVPGLRAIHLRNGLTSVLLDVRGL